MNTTHYQTNLVHVELNAFEGKTAEEIKLEMALEATAFEEIENSILDSLKEGKSFSY